MRRRSALAAFAAAGTTLLAGCGFDREPTHGDPSTAELDTEPTPTTDRPPTDAATDTPPTPLPGDVPSNRVFADEAVSEDGLGVSADRWFALDGVQFGALDQPESEPRIRDLTWYDGLDPGESASLQLVFEAPVRLDYRHYLVWNHSSPVEGASEPVYLPGRRDLPDPD